MFSDYKDIIDDFDMETCQKIYTEANCNKEKAENKLLEVYTDKVITSNTSNTVYQHSIWDSIKDFFEEVIGTLIICGLVVLGIYTYKSCDSTNDSVQEITYKNGDTYKGELKDGKFNGHGTYTWAKKEGNLLYKYEGNWVDGHREGQGVGYYADGAIYEGQWGANGVACYGVMTWPWEKIANTLKLYKYEGYFVNGLISGEGTAYYGNHKYQKGIWKNGKLVRKTEEGDWK